MIGTILKNNDISNVFCKGNVHQRNAAITAFRKDSKKKSKNKKRKSIKKINKKRRNTKKLK